MPKVVEIAGVGNVEFPDSMSDADIAKQARIAHGSAEFDRIKAHFESQPEMTWPQKAMTAAKMLLAPVTGIIHAPGEVMNWLSSADISHGGTFQANSPPDYMQANPVADAEGNMILAGGPAAAESVKAGARAVGDFATSPNVVKGLKRTSEGAVIGSAMKGNIPGVLTGGAARIIAEKLGEIGERRRAPGQPSPEMMRQASVPLTAEEQALAQHVMAGVESQPPAAPASVQTPKPAGGLTDPAYTPEPIQPGISLPTQPGTIAPPEAAAPTTSTPKRAPSGDAQSLTSKLLEWKMTPDEVHSMNEKGWIKLAYQAGVPLPSKAVRETAIVNLKHSLAGPPVSVSEMMQRFRTTPAAGTGGEAAATLAANPKALAAAQALSDALNETNVGEMMKRTRRPRK